MNYRVADYLVQACAELGVRHIFGVDGANIEDVYDAAARAPGGDTSIAGVIAKHEFAAATMADGYARATGGIGVVAATSGGGAMNLVAGLAESFTSRVPVLALVGQPPTGLEGNGAFQDTSGRAATIDALRLFGEVSRYCARVECPAELPEQFAAAVDAARGGGPAVLLLPKDVQQSVAARWSPQHPAGGRTGPVWAWPRGEGADTVGFAAVRDALAAARAVGTVVIIAGDQVARDDARPGLRALAAALDAAVGVTPDAKDVYGGREPGYCGVAGIMGHPELATAVREAAACLLVGTRLPVTAALPVGDVPVLSLGAEPPYLPATHARSRNLAVSLPRLAAEFAAPTAGRGGDIEQARPITRLRPAQADGPGLDYREVVDVISDCLPADSVVIADAGNTGAAVVHHLDVPAGGRFAVALGMGGMGYSFGAGIGSAFATGRPTYVIAGDGAFFMHGMEIHTAVEHCLPITFIVLNNNAHAMCVIREHLYYETGDRRNRFRRTCLAEGMAAMFPTLPAFAVATPGELRAALSRPYRSAAGPRFIAVDCDPDEIPPFVPFLKGAS